MPTDNREKIVQIIDRSIDVLKKHAWDQGDLYKKPGAISELTQEPIEEGAFCLIGAMTYANNKKAAKNPSEMDEEEHFEPILNKHVCLKVAMAAELVKQGEIIPYPCDPPLHEMEAADVVEAVENYNDNVVNNKKQAIAFLKRVRTRVKRMPSAPPKKRSKKQ